MAGAPAGGKPRPYGDEYRLLVRGREMKFELNAAQLAKLKAWEAEQDAEVLVRQRAEDHRNESFLATLAEAGIPYYGAVGGQVTFEFTPTSIGDLVKVRHSGTGAKLDLTYEGNFG
jgi:hypothetical protein